MSPSTIRGQRSAYSLLQRDPIAHGRLADIFLAEDEGTKRRVTLKVFRGYEHLKGSLESYYREIHALTQIRHDNILEVLDYSSGPGAAFLAMPYMEGGNLRGLLHGRNFCPPQKAFAVLSQVANAVDYAHAQGFVHGDIKPENILMDGKEGVFLADFGMARHFAFEDNVSRPMNQEEAAGTSAYLSPEQLNANVSAPSGDRYAFALVAFELLTGRLPYDVKAPLYKQLSARVQGDLLDARAVNPALSGELAATLARALDPDPAKRPQTASALVRKLRRGESWDIFLAHAGADVSAGERLFDLLSPKVRVFLDTKCLDYGDNWDRKLLQAQRNASVTVVLVSSNTDEAYYEREEIAAAIKLSREDPKAHRVIPVYLDAAAAKHPPYGMTVRHGMTITDEASWRTIANALASLVEKALADL